MSERFHRILNAMPEFAEKKTRGDNRRIVRYRKNNLTVIFRRKNDVRRRYEIQIDCDGGRDTFYVYDYNTPLEFHVPFCVTENALPFCKTVDIRDESILKGEILDFIDDYCTLS